MSNLVYQIQITLSNSEKQLAHENLDSKITIGSSPEATLSFSRHGLAPINGHFNIQNSVLTYTHLGQAGDTFIGEQQCQHKKMYILDTSDRLTMGELTCIIKKGIPLVPELHIEQDKLLKESSLPREESLSKPVLDEEPDGMTLIGLEIMHPDGSHENKNEKSIPVTLPKNVAKPKQLEVRETKRKKSSKENNIEFMKKKKVKVKRVSESNFAGILPRLIGDIYNLLIFVLLYFHFQLNEIEVLKSVTESFYPLYFSLKKSLPTIFDEFSQIILSQNILSFLIAFLFWNIATSTLLSLNAGQWLIGLFSSGPFLRRRATAPIRVLISLVTTPFLIFDMPVLLRRRSLKELITASYTSIRSIKLTVFMSVIILPLAIVYFSMINLFQNPEALKRFKDNPHTKSAVKILPLKKSYSEESQLKQLNIKNTLFGRKAIVKILPSLEFIAELTNDDKTSNILFTLYDKDIDQFVSFTHRQLIIRTEISQILEKDPLLNIHSKDMIPDQTNKLDYLDSKIIKMIYDLLTLSQANIADYVSKYGVFLNPHFKLYEKVMRKIQGEKIQDLQLLKRAGEYHLSFTKDGQVFLMSTNDIGISLYEFATKSNKAKALLAKKYIEDIHSHSKVVSLDNDSDHPIELLYQITRSTIITTTQANTLVKFHMDLAKGALIGNSEAYTTRVLEVFKNNEQQFLDAIKDQNNPNLSELRLALNRIQKALYKREKEFFELNP